MAVIRMMMMECLCQEKDDDSDCDLFVRRAMYVWSDRVVQNVTRPDWSIHTGKTTKIVSMIVTPRVKVSVGLVGGRFSVASGSYADHLQRISTLCFVLSVLYKVSALQCVLFVSASFSSADIPKGCWR